MTKRTGPAVLLVAVVATIVVAYVLRVVRPPAPGGKRVAETPPTARPAKVSGGKLKGGPPPAPEAFDVTLSAIPMLDVVATGLAPQDIPPLSKPRTVGGAVSPAGAKSPVLGLVVDGVWRAYPIDLLSRHWVVNDVVGGRAVAVFWDPVADASVAYQATVDRKPRQFGATGYCYHGNALFYEAETGSLFLPVLGRFVTGPLAQRPLRPIVLERCEWAGWLKRHPETRVAAEKGAEGVSDPRASGRSPGSPSAPFPADPQQRLAPTDEVLGFIGTDGKAYCCAIARLPTGKGEGTAIKVGGARLERTADGQPAALLPGGVWPQQVICRYGAWYGVHPDTVTEGDGGQGTGDRNGRIGR
jgi:hypothetical protein